MSSVDVISVQVFRASVRAVVELGNEQQASQVASAVATNSLSVQHNSDILSASSTNPSTGGSDEKHVSTATVAAIVAGVAAGLCLLVLVVVIVGRRRAGTTAVLPKEGHAISYSNPYFHDVVEEQRGVSMFSNPTYDRSLDGVEPTYSSATDA